MAEWCLGSKPLHRLCRLSVKYPATESGSGRGVRTSEREETPRCLGGLDQSLADPLVLIRLEVGLGPHGR
jgi:hypothetical protein